MRGDRPSRFPSSLAFWVLVGTTPILLKILVSEKTGDAVEAVALLF